MKQLPVLDRRDFLGHLTLLAVGSILCDACGDGQIGNATTGPIGSGSLTVRIADYTSLATVGGIARITGAALPIAVVRSGDTTYRAFSLVCPHQGSTVNILGSGFQCPNHLARFNASGQWIGGQRTSNLGELTVTTPTAGTLVISY